MAKLFNFYRGCANGFLAKYGYFKFVVLSSIATYLMGGYSCAFSIFSVLRRFARRPVFLNYPLAIAIHHFIVQQYRLGDRKDVDVVLAIAAFKIGFAVDAVFCAQ